MVKNAPLKYFCMAEWVGREMGMEDDALPMMMCVMADGIGWNMFEYNIEERQQRGVVNILECDIICRRV